jgi:hypothetical protein
MRQFMEGSPVKIDWLEKACLRRHVNAVAAGVIIGLGVVALELRACGGDQRLGGGDRQRLRNRLGLNGVIEGQAVALGDVENRKTFEKRDAPPAVLAAPVAAA